MAEAAGRQPHTFISYVREDALRVAQLQQALEASGIPVWLDTDDLWPGEDWAVKIEEAIVNDSLVFLACFSTTSLSREKSYQFKELSIALEQMKLRRPNIPWLIPVRFDDCSIPPYDVGMGRSLNSIQRADLFGASWDRDCERLVASIKQLMGKLDTTTSTGVGGHTGAGKRRKLSTKTGGETANDSIASRSGSAIVAWSTRGADAGSDDLSTLSRTIPRPRSTFADFPFGELSPEDFHRLGLHLLDSRERFVTVENYGQTGADHGVDAFARRERQGGSETTDLVVVQFKRLARFTVSSARSELRVLADNARLQEVAAYLLVTAGTVSSSAIDELRLGLRDLGIDDLEIWDRAMLTVKLVQRQDLARYFFGHPTRAQSPRVSEWIEQAVATGRVTVVIGSAAHLGASDMRRRSEALAKVAVLGEYGIVDQIVCFDPTVLVTEALGGVASHARTPAEVVQCRDALDGSRRVLDAVASGALVLTTLTTAIEDRLIADGLTDGNAHSDRLARVGADFDVTGDGDFSLVDPDEFFDRLLASVRPWWLWHYATRLDFDEVVTVEGLVAGARTAPGIVSVAYVPGDFSKRLASLRKLGYVAIVGPSGSGKTTEAFLLAQAQQPAISYIVDLADCPTASVDDVVSLVTWLSEQDEPPVLVIDNAHRLPNLTDAIKHLMTAIGASAAKVILAQTTGLQSTGQMPPQLLDRRPVEASTAAPGSLRSWEAREFTAWIEPYVDPRRRTQLSEAALTAQNPWHFMYLLRGSAQSVVDEIDASAERDDSHVVWYAVAAAAVFRGEMASLSTIWRLLDDHQLWPLRIATGDRGPWLVKALDDLVARKLVVAGRSAYFARHPLEATALLRMLFDIEHAALRTFRTAGIALFGEALRNRIAVPQELYSPAATKAHVYQFCDAIVDPAIERQLALEQAVPTHADVQSHVDAAWQEVVEWASSTTMHHLYWLANRSNLTHHAFQFPPLDAIRQILALEYLREESDAIDFDYFVKAVTSNQALRSVQVTASRRAFVASVRSQIESVDEQVERLVLVDIEVATASAELVSPEDSKLFENLKSRLRSTREHLVAMLERNETDDRPQLPVPDVPVTPDWMGNIASEVAQIEAARPLLDRARRTLGPALEAADRARLSDGLAALRPGARTGVLVNLLLLSPRLVAEVLSSGPDEWRDHLTHSIEAVVSGASDRIFFSWRQDLPLAFIIANACDVLPALQSAVDQLGVSDPVTLRAQIVQSPNEATAFLTATTE